MKSRGIDAPASSIRNGAPTAGADTQLEEAVRRAVVAKKALQLAEAEITAARAEQTLAATRARAKSVSAGIKAESETVADVSTAVPMELIDMPGEFVPLFENEIESADEESEHDVFEEVGSTRSGRLPALVGTIRGVALVVAAVAAIALVAVATLLQVQHYNATSATGQDADYVQTARQGVADMLSINYGTADADVQRVLDGATGEWKSDFQQRSDSFVSVVRDASVATTGQILSAGLEKRNEDGSASVLVAATSKVTNTAGADEEPRSWRLRVGVMHEGNQYKISKMEFVA